MRKKELERRACAGRTTMLTHWRDASGSSNEREGKSERRKEDEARESENAEARAWTSVGIDAHTLLCVLLLYATATATVITSHSF